MVTIYDIAKKTGYSAPTISKALNGTGGLSAETRKKIIAIAKELGYKPNMTARALITKKSHLIGIIFEDEAMQRGFEHPLFGGVLNKFRSEMENAEYDLIFLSRNFTLDQGTYLEHCLYRNVDAVVVINSFGKYREIIELAEANIPCISTNDIIPGIPAVITNNTEAGYTAAQYFIRNGHKKMAYIAGPHNEYSLASEERRKGFKRALEDNGIEYDDTYVAYCPYWFRESGFEGMKCLLARHPDITAVFAATDNMAIGAMEYCKEQGLQIPRDISFIGFDDEVFSPLCTPPLTSFRQNRVQIAELAAEILLNRLSDIPFPEIVRVPADFIVRQSVANKNNQS